MQANLETKFGKSHYSGNNFMGTLRMLMLLTGIATSILAYLVGINYWLWFAGILGVVFLASVVLFFIAFINEMRKNNLKDPNLLREKVMEEQVEEIDKA